MTDDSGAEEATARALVGLPAEWTVLHDVTWPGRRHADVDHVVVGPGGVFVIDSRASRRRLGSAATDCAAAARRLAAGARLDGRLVHPVLCVGEGELSPCPHGLIACAPGELVGLLVGRATVLAGEELSSTRASVATVVRHDRDRRSLTARASRRRARSDGSLGRLGAFLLLVAVTVAMVPHAAAQLEERMRPAPAVIPGVGETVRLPSTMSRPPVELTAEEVPGNRREYVVRVTVHNGGDRPLSLSGLTSRLVLDDLGHADVVRDPSVGLAGVRLEPDTERSVVYRFVVPAGRAPTELTATMGDRSADRARWRVG